MRRGVAELNGEGEVAGGVVILRSGKNARETIAAVKDKLAELKKSLPPGVEIVPTYDRSQLIDRAVDNLTEKLIEEFIVVALVCALFLWHLRSALVAIITLPLGVLAAFIVMRLPGRERQHHVAGRHRHRDRRHGRCGRGDDRERPQEDRTLGARASRRERLGEARWRVITEAAAEVGPALFFSLLIITLSFIPVFTLEAQEGRLFSPLAFTKTYAMAAAAGLAVTLIPVLMGYLIRGRIPAEQANPVNRWLTARYRPALDWSDAPPATDPADRGAGVRHHRLAAVAWAASSCRRWTRATCSTCPRPCPGLSAAKAGELLQQTDRLIKTVPEVESVFGKAGRAETATDPAPLEMFETTIQFKPRDQWRAGHDARTSWSRSSTAR